MDWYADWMAMPIGWRYVTAVGALCALRASGAVAWWLWTWLRVRHLAKHLDRHASHAPISK